MTDAELDALLADTPILFHMAEAGSWPSIRRHGLLSTSALLDLFEIEGAARTAAEARRRPRSVPLTHPTQGRAVIRDNGPINDAKLEKVLEDGLTPADWYRMLNARVFFWLSRKKLLNLLGARSYRHQAHDIIEFDARPLVEAYRAAITLSPINSGAVLFASAPKRGAGTFLSIGDYPYAAWTKKRAKGDRVAELAVTGGVPDAERFVRRVVRMQGGQEVETIFQA